MSSVAKRKATARKGSAGSAARRSSRNAVPASYAVPRVEPEDDSSAAFTSGPLDLLRRLSEACGVSGDEAAVRSILQQYLKGKVAEMRVDALGNLLVRCNARGENPLRVMVAAHMDEVGLILMQPGSEGLWKFETVGGVDEGTLPGKPVWIGASRIPGVIGAKPVHLLEKEECERPVKVETLMIDIGARDKGGALARLKPGDRAAFATPFRCERGVIFGKALDNRLGAAALAELALDPPPGIELLAAFTAQEEVGLRGAQTAAYSLDPAAAIVLDATPAYDMPAWDGVENAVYNARLGFGPAIYVADRGTVSDRRLVNLLEEVGSAMGIPRQMRQPGGGGTDAGAIHLAREGIPCVSVSVPCRGLHAPLSTARLDDWRGQVALIRAALERLGKHGLAALPIGDGE